MTRTYTVATSGHVDHGKSALVRALTGIDPDRLAEEKRREMTIDLGFAWLTLPDVGQVGIVDVPGHRDFIDNMLAGIGGIDAVMLIVAADEGLMPQTREHLTILDLLGVSRGLVALTKVDLVDDPDWLALVQDEIAQSLHHTSLVDFPIVPVSAFSGQGLDDLRAALAEALLASPPQAESGAARLPVDRVFTLSGFGTIVTGTLRGGPLRVGDEVELLPGGPAGRIRGLQNHKQAITLAHAGARTAVNLSGVSHEQVERGMVLAPRGRWQPTALVDAQLTLAAAATRPLKHGTAIKLHWGSAVVNATVRLLNKDEAGPGETAWGQLVLSAPLALADGDRLILRIPSPEETIAGAVVVDAYAARRWRRRDARVLDRLEARAVASPAQQLARLAAPEPVTAAALREAARALSAKSFAQTLDEAIAHGLLHASKDGTYWATEEIERLRARVRAELAAYHTGAPLRLGMPREALRSRLGVRSVTLAALLEGWDEVVVENELARLAGHALRLNSAQQAARDALLSQLRAAPYTPPSYHEAVALAGPDVVQALIDTGDVVRVQADVILDREAYTRLVDGTLAIIDAHGSVTASELRDQFQTSRKYAIALLEHLDSRGVTLRRGDARVRSPRS
jgi:selenocysteine-specific elongation factor